METSFAGALSLNSSDTLNMPQLASSPSTKEDCVGDIISGNNKLDSKNADVSDKSLMLNTYSDTPCNTASYNTISALQTNSSDSKTVKDNYLNSSETQNNIKDNVKLCLEQCDPATLLLNRSVEKKSNGCSSSSSSTVSSCSTLAAPVCDGKDNQNKDFPLDDAQISTQKPNGTSQHQDKSRLVDSTASKHESAQNNGELELPEVEDEAKGRFNLRKRRMGSGTFEGYNDSDLSAEEDEAAAKDDRYKRRRTGGYSYSSQCLLTAANVIKNTGCTVKQAANEYGIPITTLSRFYKMFQSGNITSFPQPLSAKGESREPSPIVGEEEEEEEERGGSWEEPAHDGIMRRPSVSSTPKALHPLEEHQLATYISLLSRSGKSISYADIKVIAQQILQSKEKKAFRRGNCPTGGWIQKFKARHPELQYKTHDHFLMKTNCEPTLEDLESWQSDLRLFLRLDWKLELETLFTPENANRIFTCDEILIAFTKLDDRGEKIPLKSLLKKPNGDDKHLVTVIAAASAAGDYLKPHLLLSHIPQVPSQFPTLDPASYASVHSETGLLTPEIFLDWASYLDAYLSQNNVTRPIVLLLDDHAAHFHISVFLYCLDRQIIPVCLPPKLNKMIQPLLVTFFPKLMVAYQACCKRYTSKTGNGITHDTFPYIMLKAWTLVTKPKFITEGFMTCKLIPMQVTSLEVSQKAPPASSPPQVAKPCILKDAESTVKVKDEPTSNHSEDDGDEEESSAPQEEPATPLNAVPTRTKQKKVFKKRKMSMSPSCQSSSSSSNGGSGSTLGVGVVPPNEAGHVSAGSLQGIVLGDELVSQERRIGRKEGVEMCLSVLESFVPADILPVWRRRASSHSGTCEIGYCMWKAVQLLHQGGIDTAGQGAPQLLQYGHKK